MKWRAKPSHIAIMHESMQSEGNGNPLQYCLGNPMDRASLGLRLCEGRHGMSVLFTRVPSIVRGPWMTCAEWGLSRLWLQVHQTLSSLGSDHPSFFFPRTPFVSSESSPYTLLNRGRQALYHGSTQVNPEAEISTSRERLVQVTRRPLSPLII